MGVGKIIAPWTEPQVQALNRWQRAHFVHPFTCGGGHRKEHPDGEGVLIATRDGWICQWCKYTQDWAWDFMFDRPIDPLAKVRKTDKERENYHGTQDQRS